MYNKIEKQNKAGSFCNVATIRDADGEMQWVEENINDITVRQENSYQGWQCYAGLESLMIDAKGDVYVATCRGKKLGNIFDDFENLDKGVMNFALFTENNFLDNKYQFIPPPNINILNKFSLTEKTSTACLLPKDLIRLSHQ